MDDDSILTLESDDGEEKFGFLDFVEYGGEDFIVLYPLERENGQLLILRVEEDATSDEYDSYVGIDDDDLVQAVFEKFMAEHKDELGE